MRMEGKFGTVALAGALAFCIGGAVGVGCGSDSESGPTVTESTHSGPSQKPNHKPRIPSEGGRTVTEPSP